MSFKVPNKYRVREGRMASDESFGNNGAFIVSLRHKQDVFVIASDAFGWEHVSVSRRDRCPTWEEMCQIKDQFWDAEDCVVQFHPPASEYVNNHPRCLHLWRQIGSEFPLPDSLLVGIKGAIASMKEAA
jgi:hypothetical protein